MKKKIICIESSRAEHSHLFWVLKELEAEPCIDLSLVLVGGHLVSEFGNTAQLVRQDGFTILDTIESIMASDSDLGTSISFGIISLAIAKIFDRHRPDLILILGDRYEMLAVGSVATLMRIPIVHIHGGESTEGLVDEAIRHAITKMSHLHFASTQMYAQRIIHMGESPDHVFHFGAPGLDNIKRMSFYSKEELEKDLGIKIQSPLVLSTFHPVTLEPGQSSKYMNNLLTALESLNATIIFTYPNQDAEGRSLAEQIKEFCNKKIQTYFFNTLGIRRYYSLMKLANLMVGNSSSGIIESGSFSLPVVNIGERQRGRIAGKNVIHSDSDTQSILKSINICLSQEFLLSIKNMKNPYGDGDAAKLIAKTIINFPLSSETLKKKFHSAIN